MWNIHCSGQQPHHFKVAENDFDFPYDIPHENVYLKQLNAWILYLYLLRTESKRSHALLTIKIRTFNDNTYICRRPRLFFAPFFLY